MPAPIINGLITFMTTQLNVTCWDGEVPRQDASGNAVNPDAVTMPQDWPVVKVFMKEPGFSRTWNFEDAYEDNGGILIQVWATGRASAESQANGIETLLARRSNWDQINLGDPYYVEHLLLTGWYSGQEEGVRTSKSELLYRFDMHYEARLHGNVATS